jgi:hypothetical protein
VTRTQFLPPVIQRHPFLSRALQLTAIALLLAGCGFGFGGSQPTRTPVPTWTPTPPGAAPAEQAAQNPAPTDPNAAAQAAQNPAPVDPNSAAQAAAGQSAPVDPNAIAATAAAALAAAPPPTDTPTPVPPTPTPEPPTNTPEPSPTPTDTPTPEPTPTPAYTFELEETAKFPTESLAANVVRIYLYAYSPADLGLEGYTLRVLHNGSQRTVEERTTGGVPRATRDNPGPFTRFTNLDVIFVEAQAGTWEVQLLDPSGVPAGPPATFELTPDEQTRELYVRYRLK